VDAYHKTPVLYRNYGIIDPEERWASGRADGSRSFSQKNSQREHDVRGAANSGQMSDLNTSFACGSMVRYISF
jgi:hypothetical protein